LVRHSTEFYLQVARDFILNYLNPKVGLKTEY
jgi:hypothetical protein